MVVAGELHCKVAGEPIRALHNDGADACLRSKARTLDSYSQSQSQGRRCVAYVCYDPGGVFAPST